MPSPNYNGSSTVAMQIYKAATYHASTHETMHVQMSSNCMCLFSMAMVTTVWPLPGTHH